MNRAFRLGLFIVGTLAVLGAGVFLIGNKQFLFSSTYRLNADFPTVTGLSDAAEVRVGGIRQGTVKRIDLPHQPDGKVRVVMDLKSRTRDVVKKDSRASIEAEGLIGDKHVNISFGSNESPSVNNGDTISAEPPIELSEIIKKTDQILDTAKGTVANLDATANNLKSVSDKVNQGKGTVGALINDKSVYEHANAGATAFQENMEALKHNFLLRGFFRNRGYEDSTELTSHQISRLPRGQPARTFEYDAKKVFAKPDTAKLKDQKILNEAGHYLEQNGFGLAVVGAYTSMKGDKEKNKVLTEARAMVVRDYLVKNFRVDDARIKTMGLGESQEADEGKVEILVYPAGAAVAANPRQPAARH